MRSSRTAKKHATFKRLVYDELRETLQYHGRMGWVELIFGIGINYIWIYYMTFIEDRIHYDAN